MSRGFSTKIAPKYKLSVMHKADPSGAKLADDKSLKKSIIFLNKGLNIVYPILYHYVMKCQFLSTLLLCRHLGAKPVPWRGSSFWAWYFDNQRKNTGFLWMANGFVWNSTCWREIVNTHFSHPKFFPPLLAVHATNTSEISVIWDSQPLGPDTGCFSSVAGLPTPSVCITGTQKVGSSFKMSNRSCRKKFLFGRVTGGWTSFN